MAKTWSCVGILNGFDCNIPVTLADAQEFHKLGYRFAVRYVKRQTVRSNDLSAVEVKALHQAGLAVMPVQHVESEDGWIPSNEKGYMYGFGAVEHCRQIGIPSGTTCWLDLEGVDPHTPKEQIILYCNRWYDAVKVGGYQPGIYVGWHAGLTGEELYKRLRFERYWAAYNLNVDQYPAVRGVCMKQAASKSPVSRYAIDGDIISADKLGGFPTLYVPDEWDPR
jgi:hypothetical protein